ncbi:MAG: HAD family phosphatase [Ruminococcus sp.]|nr:HAD family phosphatase [Ruminococcus sp.]
MDMNSFKGAIFDLDGTIIDSAYVWAEVDRQFVARRGLALPDDYGRAVSSMNFDQAAAYTKKRFGLPDSIESITNEWKQQAIEEYRLNVKPIPGACEYLKMLKGRGVKIALATASDRVLYTPALKRMGMFELFDHFSQTSDVARGKGFPDVYEHAAEGLSLSACECMVFEDIPEGLKGASDGGFYSVAVTCAAGKYDIAELERYSDMVIRDFTELL